MRVKITPTSWGYIQKKRKKDQLTKYQAQLDNLLGEIYRKGFDIYIPGYPNTSLEGATVDCDWSKVND